MGDIKLTFDEFKYIIEKMRDITDAESKINDLYRQLNFRYKEEADAGHFPNMIPEVLSFLEKIMNDKDEWISYWIFDKDFGRDMELGNVMDENGPIPLSTVEELWEFLMSNNQQ